MTDLQNCISKLGQLNTKDRKLCIETLLKIFRNVCSNPNEEKYRTLKLSNKRFNEEVWRHDEARAILVSSGWVVVEDTVHLPDGVDLGSTVELLVANRNVKPDEREWVEGNKLMGENRRRIREEELKRKALLEKEKEIARLKKDMVERKAIAQRIVSEHRNDQQSKKVTKPAIASPRGDGGGAKMSDMVSKGGG